MNRNQVPYVGILITASVCVIGVLLNYVVPAQAFEIVLNFASIGIIATWAIIVVCHLIFVRRARAGLVERPAYRLPWTPLPQLAVLGFLVAVLVLMAGDHDGRITLYGLPVLIGALVLGWYRVRARVGTDLTERR